MSNLNRKILYPWLLSVALGAVACSSDSGADGAGGTSASAGTPGIAGAIGTGTAGGVALAGASNGGSAAAGTGVGGNGNAGAAQAGASNGGAGSPAGGAAQAGSSTGGTASAGSSAGGASAGTGTGGTAGAGGGTLKKFVGNITTNNAVRDGFAKYWTQITPENEGKWGTVEPTRGNRNWTNLDKIYKYTQDNGIVFKHHVFVWGSQQPSWVSTLSAAEQQTAVKDWISAFCTRYPNTQLIDVVNEPPPHTTPGYKNGIGGDGTSGYDWIVNAFKWARASCPKAVLILNDYNNIEYADQNAHFIDIANKVKAAGAPIDGLGAQAHDAFKIPTATVKSYIDKLAATGLPVYITEYDIDLADDAQQKSVMQEQFTMFYTHPNVKGITLWGYIVGATWRPNTGLQQANGTMRPAMTWLMGYLGK